MGPKMLQEVREILDTQRVLSLAVLVDGTPYVGLLPYVVTPDYQAAFVHASRLSRHTRGLADGAPFGILVHPPDRADGDPLQIPRLSVQGVVQLLDRGDKAYDEARRLYTSRFSTSGRTFLLGDFNLYRLQFERGRYVGGFATAADLTPDALVRLARMS